MTSPASLMRWRVAAGTTSVVALYVGALWFAYSVLLASSGLILLLRLPLAVFLVQAVVIALLTAGICFLKMARRIREWRAGRRREAMEAMVAGLACGPLSSTESIRIRMDPLWLRHREDLALHLETMLLTTKGDARGRLSRLASEIGLTAHWLRESRRLGGDSRRIAVRRLGLVEGYTIPDRLAELFADPDPAVRIAVYRAMLKTGGEIGVSQVFEALTGESLLICALLNGELGKHAAELGERALPDALRTDDAEKLKRVLDMIGAWRRAVVVPDLDSLLQSSDSGVQRRLLGMLPYLKDESYGDSRIRTELANLAAAVLGQSETRDEEVLAAAATAAGRLGMRSAIPLLERCLRHLRHRVVRGSAEALAELGPPGLAVLEREILSSGGPAASAALEALERFQSAGFSGGRP